MPCAFPHCRQPTEYEYIGKDLCRIHFVRICECDANSQKENMLLEAIGLVRVDGSVRPRERGKNNVPI